MFNDVHYTSWPKEIYNDSRTVTWGHHMFSEGGEVREHRTIKVGRRKAKRFHEEHTKNNTKQLYLERKIDKADYSLRETSLR
jgi:hypothetical protein